MIQSQNASVDMRPTSGSNVGVVANDLLMSFD